MGAVGYQVAFHNRSSANERTFIILETACRHDDRGDRIRSGHSARRIDVPSFGSEHVRVAAFGGYVGLHRGSQRRIVSRVQERGHAGQRLALYRREQRAVRVRAEVPFNGILVVKIDWCFVSVSGSR